MRHDAAAGPGAGASGRERRLVAMLTSLLSRATPLLAIAWIVSLPVPYLLGWGNIATVTIPALSLLLALGLARTESHGDRRMFVSLFLVGYLLRFGAVVLIAGATGHPPLGPDSTTYLRESQLLAGNHLVTDTAPYAYNGFGTFDVAHYYLFALFIMVFGSDLVGLQLLNSALAALVAPLMFGWCRRVAGRYAVFVGVVLAVHPSLIVLASIDLLKDPSVMFFAALALWAVSRFEERRIGVTAAAFFAIAIAGLTYLRMDRFYLVAYAELAVLISGVLFLRHALSKREVIARSLPIVLLFVVVEAGPFAVGWPPSPVLVYQDIENILRNQPGLLGLSRDTLRNSSTVETPSSTAIPFESHTAQVVGAQAVVTVEGRSAGSGRALAAFNMPSPASSTDSTMVRTYDPVMAEAAAGQTATPSPSPTPERLPERLGSSWMARIVVVLADSFRRLFGPYVWVPPERWDLDWILRSDLPLYPGMVVWYAGLPLFAIGVGVTVIRAVRGLERRASLVTLAIFLLFYFLQYLVLDLSYRQRDTMLPFLAVFGLMGLYRLLRSRRFLAVYRLYWVVLLLIAVGHSVVRAALGGA